MGNEKCSFQIFAEVYYSSPMVLDKTQYDGIRNPTILAHSSDSICSAGNTQPMPSEESRKTCLLTNTGAHTREAPTPTT